MLKLNAAEKFLMNNLFSTARQRRHEAPLPEQLGGYLAGGQALEIGGGRGIGAELIFRRFGAREVRGFDHDPHVAAIPGPNASFDAVFDFGIVHHVPDWEPALTKVVRVLKPGGCFYFVTRQAPDRRDYRTFLKHPREHRFSKKMLLAAHEQRGSAWLAGRQSVSLATA